MTDKKATAQANSNDTLTVSSLKQLGEIPEAGNASTSLGKLENDLHMLHLKWQAVESEIAERDDQIASLRQEVDEYQSRCGSLETDLEALTATRDALSADLASQCQTVSESDSRFSKLEAQNIELNVHRQELQDYIDGRKSAWDKLNTRISEYEDTIRGMSDDLASHDKIVAGKEDEIAALAVKVMELERELSALQGRYSEKESSNALLQQNLEDQSRELGSLSGDAIRFHKDIDKMQKKLGRKEETVKSLRRELKERDRDSSTLETLLSDEKSTIAELQLKLTVANQRIEELLADQQLRTADLQAALRANEAVERQSTDKLGEFEIRSAELQAELTELRANYKNAEEELDAQRELVQMLELEVSNSQRNLEVVNHSADRMSALGTGIRELDMQIDDLWLKKTNENPEPSQEIFEQPDEVLIPPEDIFDVGKAPAEHLIVADDASGGEEISYSLNGEDMTIGRAPHNAIRLKSKFISRVHARIWIEGSTAIIEDAGSTNGFLINSKQAHRHELQHGDELEIGYSKLRYVHNA